MVLFCMFYNTVCPTGKGYTLPRSGSSIVALPNEDIL